MQERLEKNRPKKKKNLTFLEVVVNSRIKVSNVFFKSKAFHCLLACANRPLKLKCSFLFVLVYSWPIFKSVVLVTKLLRFAGHEDFVIVNNILWSEFRKSNRYSTKWHKLRNSRVEYFCCGSIVCDLKDKQEN